MEIPKGKTRPEIKAREKIIKDFYAKWISENPSKSVWNKSLKADIKVKGLSYNETIESNDNMLVNYCLHSVGVMPVKALNVRKKEVSLEKPDCIHTSTIFMLG